MTYALPPRFANAEMSARDSMTNPRSNTTGDKSLPHPVKATNIKRILNMTLPSNPNLLNIS